MKPFRVACCSPVIRMPIREYCPSDGNNIVWDKFVVETRSIPDGYFLSITELNAYFYASAALNT
jgi:hypothetical protein